MTVGSVWYPPELTVGVVADRVGGLTASPRT
jgi:hypothetical protein